MAQNLSNADGVRDYIEDEKMVTYNFMSHPQQFYSREHFDVITDPHVIHNVVAKELGLILNNREQASLITKISKSGRKLFAICVCTEIPLDFLKAMLDNGLTDERLPLTKSQLDSLRQKTLYVKSFLGNQKQFNTISFTEDSHYCLDERFSDGFSIPIHRESVIGEGAFGQVWEVLIHHDYHDFSCVCLIFFGDSKAPTNYQKGEDQTICNENHARETRTPREKLPCGYGGPHP